MQELYLPLNGIAVLSGISIAIIQYLFINHQNNIKNLLSEFSDMVFLYYNHYEQSLKTQWESLLIECKQHSYSINPSKLINIFFINIIMISGVYVAIFFENLLSVSLILFVKIIVIAIIYVLLFVALILSLFVLYQMEKKEKYYKNKFQYIQKRHQLAQNILNNKE